ncbi:MAG: O-antigen ligase family protein [Micromonosporaceae bacterium]
MLTLTPEEVRERSVRRRVGLVWGLLVLNVLTYSGSLLHIPTMMGKAITQGALPLALLVALTVNRRIVVRPNVFLCLVSLLAIEAILMSLEVKSFGAGYRIFRLTEFVAVLWLLTPWWGRLLLVRYHLVALAVILSSVLLGLVVVPGRAMAQGRLGGIVYGIAVTQVAHYAAIMLGLVVVLWLSGRVRGRVILPVVVVAVTMLVLTHTRTALVAVVVGIIVAGLSLIVAKPRVRKFFLAASVVVSIAMMTLSSVLITWLARGEGTQQLNELSGRTLVWGPLLAFPRDRSQMLFGFGLSNASFNGLPIDSNWLTSYQEQGLFGVAVCVAILLFLFVTAYFQPRGAQRALGLFLVTYCLVASYTEVGFTDASMYLLDLYLAASLLVPSVRGRRPTLVG